MKAYTLGRRGKWKDYVDLYFILKDYFSFSEIANKAKEILKMNLMKKFSVRKSPILMILITMKK